MNVGANSYNYDPASSAFVEHSVQCKFRNPKLSESNPELAVKHDVYDFRTVKKDDRDRARPALSINCLQSKARGSEEVTLLVQSGARATELLDLTPDAFERFSERLLRAYGFEKVNVTRKSRDGEIDGHGRLTVGLTTVSVAFQCKRYKHKPVGRESIDDVLNKKQLGASVGSLM